MLEEMAGTLNPKYYSAEMQQIHFELGEVSRFIGKRPRRRNQYEFLLD